MIYALIILAITNIGTLALFGGYLYLEHKEKAKTINALISKNSQEFINHEMVDKTEKIKVEPQQDDIKSDLEALSEMTDEEFDDRVLN